VGVKLAQDSLDIAQGAQKVWVATGALPDTGPLCKGLSDAVEPVPRLLKDAGVKGIPVEVEALAGEATEFLDVGEGGAAVGAVLVADWDGESNHVRGLLTAPSRRGSARNLALGGLGLPPRPTEPNRGPG